MKNYERFRGLFSESGIHKDRRIGKQGGRDPGHDRLGEIPADNRRHLPG